MRRKRRLSFNWVQEKEWGFPIILHIGLYQDTNIYVKMGVLTIYPKCLYNTCYTHSNDHAPWGKVKLNKIVAAFGGHKYKIDFVP